MAQVRALLSNFSGGELSPRVHGRVDIKKYAAGCHEIENAIVVPHGGVRKRPGSRFVIPQLSNSDTVRLVEFQYSTEQAYIIVFGPSYCWFIKDRGIITYAAVNITGVTKANPAVVTATAHGFSNGDVVVIASVGGMTELNNRIFTVANVTANTFELSGINSSSYTTYTSGGTAAEIVKLTTTYTQDELDELQFAQVNDVLYIAHENHPLSKLSRTSHTAWTLTEPDITTGPFRTINGDRNLRMTCSFDSWAISGATQANPCVLTVTAHGFTIGEYVGIDGVGGMTQLNGRIFEITGTTTNTITINVDSTAYGVYTSGGTATFNASLYGTYIVGDSFTLTASSAVFDGDMVGALFRLNEEGGGTGIQTAPVGDDQKSLYVGLVYTYEGNVYGVGNVFTLDNELSAGSGGAVGGGGTVITTWETIGRVPAHTAGTVRVYGSAPSSGTAAVFDSDFLHPGYCIVRITAVNSSTEAEVEIVRYQLPSSIAQDGTSFWEEGAWSDYRGYPSAITLFEQRLWLGGNTADPSTLWASNSGAFESFEDGSDDADALVYRLASGSADGIRWLSGGRILTAGTSAGEYAIAASNQNEALTPSNVQAKMQTTFGTSMAQPIRINQAVLYPQRSGVVDNPARKLREFAYSFQADAYDSEDLTIFSEHITGSGFEQIVYVADPDSVIWLRRTDGTMAACTYERKQEVIAWHRHEMGGTSAVVESIASIPGADGNEIYLSVSRTINGGTKKYIEVLVDDFRSDTAKADAVFLDSSVIYSGASTSTISGLFHLEGQTVDVLNNGNVERGKTVSSGRITLDVATTKAVIGLRYTMAVETTDIEAGTRAGTGQSRPKKISQVWLRLLRSLGGSVARGGDQYTSADMKPLLIRTASDPMDSSPPLFSGLVPITLSGGWQRDGIIRFEHDDPVPFFVSGVVAEIDSNG